MRNKRIRWVVTGFILSSISLNALAQRSSPFEPTEVSDNLFVLDAGSGLDTGCTYRSGGPLVINVQIDRYLGEVDQNGFLVDVNTLIANKVVSRNASVRLPAFDIDIKGGASNIQPEKDRIFLNGKDLGLLSGDNNVWKLNEFQIEISDLKFPSRPSSGSSPTPVDNEIRIDIDEANVGEQWCMQVDWVELSFEAMAPIVLVHGTDADSSTWDDPPITAKLTELKIPFSSDVNMIPNGGIDGNAKILKQRLASISNEFGANSLHLISHSKGGLDARRYLSRHYSPDPNGGGDPLILSLTTINTPHLGTILSNLSVAARTINDIDSADDDIEDFFDVDWLLRKAKIGPSGAALVEQTTHSMAVFNTNNLPPKGIRIYTTSSDADLNNNGSISAGEASPLLPSNGSIGVNYIVSKNASIMYRILGGVSTFSVKRETNFLGFNEYHTLTPVSTQSFKKNDLVVTEESATYVGGQAIVSGKANHSSIRGVAALEIILGKLSSDFPLQ